MIGIYSMSRDKVNEDAVWLIEAIEPYTSSWLDGMLAKMPDELELTGPVLMDYIRKLLAKKNEIFACNIDFSDIVDHLMNIYGYNFSATSCSPKDVLYVYTDILGTVLNLVIVGDPILNVTRNFIEGGSVRIIKNMNSEYQSAIKRNMRILTKLLPLSKRDLETLINRDKLVYRRLSKLFSLLYDQQQLKNMPLEDYYQSIVVQLNKILANDEWKIRDLDLAKNFIDWVFRYINSDDADALNNILRLKSLSSRGLPIYSIDGNYKT